MGLANINCLSSANYSTGVQGYHKVSSGVVTPADVGQLVLRNYIPAGGISLWGDISFLHKILKLAHVLL